MILRYKIASAAFLLLMGILAHGQGPSGYQESAKSDAPTVTQKVVIVTGVRFSYPLIQRWIDEYNRVNPAIQIIIDSRGSSDPARYDILAEVFEHDAETKENRDYLYIGRYAVVPVATTGSAFAEFYSSKGFNKETINQVFFHNIFTDKQKNAVTVPFSVYTRLQKAGVPMAFARHFGYEQKDIKGTAIAGADSHLVKAMLRDSAGVSYLPLALAYDTKTRKPIESVTVLPVDLDGNKKVSDEEKFYDNVDNVIQRLEALPSREIKNIAVGYLHLSTDRHNASPEAIDFLRWVNENGQKDLHEFGYLKPDVDRPETKASNLSSDKGGK